MATKHWIVASLLTLSAGASLLAQTPSPTATTAVAASPYQPSMSDMMNIGVQPRHIKLWLAGKERNWKYAGYELDELRNAFARVGKTIPVYRTLDIPGLLAAFTGSPLQALDTAIKAGDGKAFDAAYVQLTTSCNACHTGTQHEMVVIKVPAGTAYPDQEFHAQR